jgi:hypothetical protein
VSDRLPKLQLTLSGEAIDEIVELVAERVLERLHDEDDRGELEYLTTAEYAQLHRTTAGAVLARIHRGTLHAIRPPGAREWLIPHSADADGKEGD